MNVVIRLMDLFLRKPINARFCNMSQTGHAQFTFVDYNLNVSIACFVFILISVF